MASHQKIKKWGIKIPLILLAISLLFLVLLSPVNCRGFCSAGPGEACPAVVPQCNIGFFNKTFFVGNPSPILKFIGIGKAILFTVAEVSAVWLFIGSGIYFIRKYVKNRS